MMAVGHFNPYIYERQFRLRTDQANLKWLHQRAEPSHRVVKWLETLAECHFCIKHWTGNLLGNVDGLSHWCSDSKKCGWIEKRDGTLTKTVEIDKYKQSTCPVKLLTSGLRNTLLSLRHIWPKSVMAGIVSEKRVRPIQ